MVADWIARWISKRNFEWRIPRDFGHGDVFGQKRTLETFFEQVFVAILHFRIENEIEEWIESRIEVCWKIGEQMDLHGHFIVRSNYKNNANRNPKSRQIKLVSKIVITWELQRTKQTSKSRTKKMTQKGSWQSWPIRRKSLCWQCHRR